MSEEETEHISLALYQYMCRHIVGTEQTVKTKRLLTTVRDNLSGTKENTLITSGSYGEGLEMKGSDFDFMDVFKYIKVYENKSDIEFDISKSYFEIKTDDTKLGFVKLLLLHSMDRDIINQCVKSDGCLFFSNNLFKSYFGNGVGDARLTEVNHGPCLSDKDGLFDIAFCLHSRSWISQAYQWMTRSQRSWPSNEVVSRITEHGTLFVPIGVKGSPNEEIEWRISFSVGEKLLVYSFTHTQLLCYALLKIVLKDIISSDIRCKDLLCSYYLKNIIFWVSEEIPLSEWKPHNLIHCFMQCFKRLIYCVEYSSCPHYFIPEINMFENKIEGDNRRVLLDQLYTLHNFSWQCILFSPQLQFFFQHRLQVNRRSQSFADYYEQIVSSSVLPLSHVRTDQCRKVVNMILSHRSPTIKLYHYFCLSTLCQEKAAQVQLSSTDRNKVMYRKYKSCKSYLLQCLYRDAVSGWLKLALLCYQMKQYKIALAILDYSLSKCSPEKTYKKSKLSPTQRSLLSSKIFQNKGLIRVLQLLSLESVIFYKNTTMVPRELELDVFNGRYLEIPPSVFAHFLSFLCYYHLSDTREYRNSLVDLQLTISENYFIANVNDKSASYNILGVALQMIGENDSAREAFQCAIRLDPTGICGCAQQRLSMMDIL